MLKVTLKVIEVTPFDIRKVNQTMNLKFKLLVIYSNYGVILHRFQDMLGFPRLQITFYVTYGTL